MDELRVLTAQRAAVRSSAQKIAQVLKNDNPEPGVAVAALCNVLANLIATQFQQGERVALVTRITNTLPMYVKVYETGERNVM